ncbi:MAG: sodium-translocating pyrophosphatase [Eubacteriales bacterium]|nr:sodium-translocating pyrophosphatase [Eubacteriales bacterium]
MEIIFLCCAFICILFGLYQITFIRQKNKDENISKIAGYIKQGAMAYLKRQYIIIAVFCVGMFVLICFVPFLGINTAIAFIVGALFSVLAGFIGMRVATTANAATATAARQGMHPAFIIAFSGGSVLGLFVVGLGALGLGLLYGVFGDLYVLTGFSLGASSVALFCRVGGGIYTKAADVGADLVGKVEAGIPEDDPRNPAVIADNVGDNVGDVAGMGADLFESYIGSIISAMLLGYAVYQDIGVTYTLLLCASGMIASAAGIFVVKRLRLSSISLSLDIGTYVSGFLVTGASLVLSMVIFGTQNVFFATLSGILAGLAIGKVTEYYTSSKYRHVKKIAHQCGTGSATNILSGLAVGMRSTALPILIIAAAVLASYFSAGVFGIALAAVGMLATVANIIAVDAYGPIADNAGGLAQMTEQDKSVRKITDSLDSVGNTTAAIGKGFSIGSAALTALALFTTYANRVDLSTVNVLDPKVIAGVLIGGMLSYLFAALTIEAVSKAANKMIDEVRRQFREITGIMTGEAVPEYAKCVDISTKAALRQMILPGLLAIAAPIAVGLLLGKGALAGLLVGATVTGVPVAIQMANSGGAWDNAKKHIEEGNFGGAGSDHHKAAVIGDTVGDPMKDTAGPSINILIKLMGIVAVVFASLFLG